LPPRPAQVSIDLSEPDARFIKWPPLSLARILRRFEDEVPEYNRRAFRGPKGYQAGRIGELVVMDYLQQHGIAYRKVYSTRHDIVVHGKRWEIKTKERSVEPRLEFDCTIPDYNADHQDPEVYVFVSLLSKDRRSDDLLRFESAWILGAISSEYFHEICTTHAPSDPPDVNGWVPTVACHNVPANALHPIHLLRSTP
jgi:hypothetical protein